MIIRIFSNTFAVDIQINCSEAVLVDREKKQWNPYKASYFGFSSSEDAEKAMGILKADPLIIQSDLYIDFYRNEGSKYINITLHPKEAYLFYNSL